MASPDLQERGRTEIANQAAIFKLAAFSGAWLNFVPSWDGLNAAITWLSLVYLECEGYSKRSAHEFITDMMEGEQLQTHLVHLEESKYTLEGWFTSLWTLQELCLRPDMVLYDKDWRPLTQGNFVVPFDHISTLSRILLTASFGDDPEWPEAVRQLYYVLIQTGIQDLPTMSPTAVLLYGNQRYCQDRRAEAIMSVVGAREWFRKPSPVTTESLMEGRYPFSFITEVKEKLGGTFFAWADTDYDEVSPAGTMLPFSHTLFAGRRALGSITHPIDHPSVSSWGIQQNGQLFLPQVGIVASTTRNPTAPIFAFAQVPWGSPGMPNSYSSPQNLHHWMKSFSPEVEKHAVALLRMGNKTLIGLLLEEESPGCLKKFGIFTYEIGDEANRVLRGSDSYEFPPSETVDWLVL